VRLARLLALCVALMTASVAVAHDLPFGNNRAAREALTIERGARASNSNRQSGEKLFSLVSFKLKWNQSTLKVCFWNGTTELRDRVHAIADELTVGLPVKFIWSGTCPGPAVAGGAWEGIPVRVSLASDQSLLIDGDDPHAYFAMIGREIAFDRPATVNLPFPTGPDEALLRNKVLHEFCHVLGCLHEHQRAGCADLFDKVAVMKAYQLSEADYQQNFALLPQGGLYGPTTIGPLDDASVMLYTFTPNMFRPNTKPLCLRASPAIVLSGPDIQGLAKLYAPGGFPVLSLDAFPKLALQNSQLALNRRNFLSGYSSLLSEVGDNPVLAAPLHQTIETLRRQADEAEFEANSYRLAPEDVAMAKKALALLPKD